MKLRHIIYIYITFFLIGILIKKPEMTPSNTIMDFISLIIMTLPLFLLIWGITKAVKHTNRTNAKYKSQYREELREKQRVSERTCKDLDKMEEELNIMSESDRETKGKIIPIWSARDNKDRP